MVATTDYCSLAATNVGTIEWPLPLVKLIVDAAPASLQVNDGKNQIPVLVAASNPSTPVDVLWFLITECHLSVSTMRIALMMMSTTMVPSSGQDYAHASSPVPVVQIPMAAMPMMMTTGHGAGGDFSPSDEDAANNNTNPPDYHHAMTKRPRRA